MDTASRIDDALQGAVAGLDSSDAPPRTAAAIRHAVFPGGSRIRPRLCLAVAMACGDDDPATANVAAAAIEMLHCASLVHDDLPCFDDAAMRRNRPTVHRAFGEREAVLAGDALIVMAFEALARNLPRSPERTAQLLATVAAALSMPSGIIAGQAWECEPVVDLRAYQRAKTGALFVAATVAGAQAAGAPGGSWRTLGARLGEAYQIADDIRDVAARPEEVGKPVGRDRALGRPNAVEELGMDAAVERFTSLVGNAVASIPRCPGQDLLRHLIRAESERLIPEEYLARAA
ncbi:MAG TPA: polyprenyl synthetase family protein [Burkholderiaceae bacterium]|nr:polyprenyl synthetase family protein [Burkholderiaceae bacterium]